MAFQTVNRYIATTEQGFWAAHKLLAGQINSNNMPLPLAQTFFLRSSHLLHFFNIIEWHLLPSYIAVGSNFLLLRFPFIPSYSHFASLHPENCMHEWLLRRASLRGGQTALHNTHHLLFTQHCNYVEIFWITQKGICNSPISISQHPNPPPRRARRGGT